MPINSKTNTILNVLRELDWPTPEYLLAELDHTVITDHETPETIEDARRVLTRLVSFGGYLAKQEN